jgi:uncharacterized coiled-coil protein SlyX
MAHTEAQMDELERVLAEHRRTLEELSARPADQAFECPSNTRFIDDLPQQLSAMQEDSAWQSGYPQASAQTASNGYSCHLATAYYSCEEEASQLPVQPPLAPQSLEQTARTWLSWDTASDDQKVAAQASEMFALHMQAAIKRLTVPDPLYKGFDPCSKVQPHDPERFENIRKVMDAHRNQAQVHLMHDLHDDQFVAVKRMPNTWVKSCHEEFVCEYPMETELPWQDIGASSFLTAAGFPYACPLVGVFRGKSFTDVVTHFASEGDLFSWCTGDKLPLPGIERENMMRPLARQILNGVQQLHDLSIVHRDLSLENILLSTNVVNNTREIRLIDFSMASTSRKFRNCVRGKASYQAPELHETEEYDAFLSDAFSVGVSLYAMLMKDYPWLSTRHGMCSCFRYCKKYGFRAYIKKRKMRNSTETVASCMSEPLVSLLEGLLCFDPQKRTTLGENNFYENGRHSVWDEPWLYMDGDQ